MLTVVINNVVQILFVVVLSLEVCAAFSTGYSVINEFDGYPCVANSRKAAPIYGQPGRQLVVWPLHFWRCFSSESSAFCPPSSVMVSILCRDTL